MEKLVLIVEDDEPLRMLLKEMLAARGFTAITAANGQEGIDLFNKINCPVIITDLEMPVMSGREFIKRIKAVFEDVIIIVLTIHKKAELIIDIMKMGIYDYIIKPVKGDEIAHKLINAFETAELRRVKRSIEKERIAKLNDQLIWFQFNEKLTKRDYQRFSKSFFKSLHTSFTMGAGMGAVLTLLNLIITSAEKEGDKYLIDSDLFEIVKENMIHADRAIKGFADINKVINEEFSLQTIPLSNLYENIQDIIIDLKSYAEKKNQTILISELKEIYKNISIDINADYIKQSIKELLINAMKFSIEYSDIVVIFETQDESFLLSVINNPVKFKNGIKGIPQGYENIIFEPFYRISKTVSYGYDSLDYGLGLTLVEKIIEKHNGSASAGNFKDFSDLKKEPTDKVRISFNIPLKQ
jgi:DNA-binding response OmpR family regulator